MSENEKRMAGDYEIINSVRIGSEEIVLGVNDKIQEGGKYYCGYCETNELLDLYVDGASSDSYPAIVKLFSQRINDSAVKIIEEIEKENAIVGDDKTLTVTDCTPVGYDESILNKVIVVNAEYLRPEYQRAPYQLLYVTGGNGANANARGTKVFTTNLLNGKGNVFRRHEVLGIVDVDKLPKWAKDGYEKYVKNKDRGER